MMVMIDNLRKVGVRALFVALMCFIYACPSPTKMTLPILDVGIVDQAVFSDPGSPAIDNSTADQNVLDLVETEIPDVLLADLPQADFSEGDVSQDIFQEVSASDVLEDSVVSADSGAEIVETTDTQSQDLLIQDTIEQDLNEPVDLFTPTDVVAGVDTTSCEPPQCQGALAPDWTLTDYQDNPPMEKSFDSYSGKVTVVMLLAAH
jgi:hypothetical protein